MKKLMLVSGLIAVSGIAAAQEVGKVVSSTPIVHEVGVPQRQCAPDANPRDACRSVTNFETRTTGYRVVYEYAGKQYTVQLPEDPGPTVNLQISPAVTSRSSVGSSVEPGANVESRYEERWDADRDRSYRVLRTNEGWDADRDRGVSETYTVEPRFIDRVYVAPGYYPLGPYYHPSYYSSPVWPLLGLSIGYSHGFRGYGWRGGYRGHRGR